MKRYLFSVLALTVTLTTIAPLAKATEIKPRLLSPTTKTELQTTGFDVLAQSANKITVNQTANSSDKVFVEDNQTKNFRRHGFRRRRFRRHGFRRGGFRRGGFGHFH